MKKSKFFKKEVKNVSPATIRNFWAVIAWLILLASIALLYRLISKDRNKTTILGVGYALSTLAISLVDKFWLMTDGNLTVGLIFGTFPLYLLSQFLILIVEGPKDIAEKD